MALVMLPGGWVDLRPLTGSDEQALFGAATRGTGTTGTLDLALALTLIDRLLVDRPGTLAGPGDAARLPTAVRDHLLAAVYRQVYGDRVTSSPTCLACAQAYDLSFNLSDLLAAHRPAPVPSDGWYSTEGGIRFRLPTGEDELAIIGLTADEARLALLARCTGTDKATAATWTPSELQTLEDALERVAPLLNVDLSAVCPECGAAQRIRFDVGTYLLGRLINDQAQLAGEVHTLALTYHWGLHEISSLSRIERRRFLALIENSASRARLRSATVGPSRRMG